MLMQGWLIRCQLLNLTVLKEGAPPIITYLSGGTLEGCTYNHEAGGLAKFSLGLPGIARQVTECVIRMDLDVWAAGGCSLSMTLKPDRVFAVARHRLSQKGSGCWLSLEFQGQSASDIAAHVMEISIQRLNDSSVSQVSQDRHKILVNGERIAVEVEALAEAEIQERRSQRRVKSRAIMLDGTSTPRSNVHVGRPPSILEPLDTNSKPSTPLSSSEPMLPTPKPPSISLERPAPTQMSLAKTPSSYALEALARSRALHETAASESLWTVLSYMENNSPIQISRAVLGSIHPTLPVYRVERTFPNVTDEQVMRILQSSSSNARTIWDERLSSVETIASYESGMATSLWMARPSFPTRSRVQYMASVRANGLPLGEDKAGSSVKCSASYLASMSVPLSAFEAELVDGMAVIATDRLNSSKAYEGTVPLDCWALETSKQIDEDDETLSRFFTRCTLYTCSDMPLMTPGTFGNANVRSRLARMFDALENASRADNASLSIRYPPPFVAFPSDPAATLDGSGSWALSMAKRSATLMAFTPSTATIAFSLSAVGSLEADQRPPVPKTATDDTNSSVRNGPAEQEPLRRPQKLSRTDGGVKIAELILRRDPNIVGYDIRMITTTLDPTGKVLPTDTSFWQPRLTVPWNTSIVALSQPSRDALQHVIRISLPLGPFNTAAQDPLSDAAKEPPIPRWYRKLASQVGVVQIQINAIRSGQQGDGRPTPSLKCTVDGQSLAVQSAGYGDDKTTISRGSPELEYLDVVQE